MSSFHSHRELLDLIHIPNHGDLTAGVKPSQAIVAPSYRASSQRNVMHVKAPDLHNLYILPIST